MLGAEEPAWTALVVRSYKKNYDAQKDTVYVQLASVRPNGTAKVQRLVFQDFLSADPKVMLFAAATRNAELMAVVKGSQTHELFWQMPRTGESFTISGRLYVVAAPTMSHRFGTPPRRIGNALQPEDWEEERIRQFKSLQPAYRASFTWPASGEPQNPIARNDGSVYKDANSIRIIGSSVDTGFKYTRLDAMDEAGSTSATGSGLMSTLGLTNGASAQSKEHELRCVHNAALDNFCLLVLKAQRVDHWTPNPVGPPSRVVHEQLKDGSWTDMVVNP
ncbi:hypothetical protein HKX48_004292 [Thoreauomyces humboldtii]|nr:hypothetical protein HKX48_004292 [Thoreauomyces humboldtii]